MKRLFLYFIKNPRTGEIKIGQSGNPKDRLIQLRSETQDDLVLLGCIEDKLPLETIFHIYFKDYRTHGEWFYFDDSAMKQISLLTTLKNRLEFETLFFEDSHDTKCKLCGKDWSLPGGCSDPCLDINDLVVPFESPHPLHEYSKLERRIKDVLASLGKSYLGVRLYVIKMRLKLAIQILFLPSP